MNVLEVLEKKFTSGNNIPVSRASITREEYEAIVKREPITIASLWSIIDYIDEGYADMDVVKAELGEIILRATSEYFDDTCETKEYMSIDAGGWLSPEQIEKDWPYEDEKGRYCLTYR